MCPQAKHLFEFGAFQLEPEERRFLYCGKPVDLSPKEFDLLLALVQNRDHLLPRKELKKILWPDHNVDDSNLRVTIAGLRKALDAAAPGEHLGQKYIETVSKGGYRFTAAVAERWTDEPPASAAPGAAANSEDRVDSTPLPAGASGFPAEQGPHGRRTQAASAPNTAIGTGWPNGARISPTRLSARTWGALIVLAGTLALVVGVAYSLRVANKRASVSTATTSAAPGTTAAGDPHNSRRSLVVFGFNNSSQRPEAAWLSTALSEMLSTELAAGDELRIISEEDAAQAKADLHLADTDGYSRESLRRIRQNLGADYVAVGSYFDLGTQSGRVRCGVRLQDTATGDALLSLTDEGAEAELPEIVSRMAIGLREKLGIREVPAAEVDAVRASAPSNAKVARQYSEGLQKLRVFDALAARDLFEKAIAADPEFPLAHSALSETWSALGYEKKAADEAKRALDLSSALPRPQALIVEARCREVTKDWNKAIQIYQSLLLLYPDALEYGLRLAAAQTSGRDGKGALSTIEELRKLAVANLTDPRIDLAEAMANESLGNFEREQDWAARAVAKGQAIGARLLIARALLAEGWALDNLGRTKEALEADEKAKDAFGEVGDRVGIARALKNIGDALDDQGDHEQAIKAYGEALAISREIGYQTGVVVVLNNMANPIENQGDLTQANHLYAESVRVAREIGDKTHEALGLSGLGTVLWRQGELPGAKKMFEDALAIYRAADDKARAAILLNNLAQVLEDQPDLVAAKKKYEESLALSRSIGDQVNMARTSYNIGEVLTKQGNLPEAIRALNEALAISQLADDKRQRAYALYGLGQVLLTSGDMTGARKKHQEALELRRQIGEKGTAAESMLALAELGIEEGHPGEANAQTMQAAEEFAAEKETDLQASAYAVLARSLLAQGKSSDAQEALRRATDLLRNTENPEARLFVGIDSAGVKAASGRSVEAMQECQSIIADAKKYGYLGYQFGARLALGEIEMESNQVVAGRASLETLATEAKARGFGLIAHKAAVASHNSAYR